MLRFVLAFLVVPLVLLQSGCAGAGGSGSSNGGSGSAGGGGSTSQPSLTPAIVSISPSSVTAGAAAQTVTVTGTGFVSASVVQFNGKPVPTTYTSASSLQAVVPASALAAGATIPLTVTNPSGGSSAAASFSVMSPTPAVNGVTPANVPQGATATLTIHGSGFETNSVVLWNGSARPTAFVDPSTITVTLTAADVAQIGNAQITINNPGPGGSTTPPTPELVYAVPSITSLSPSSVQAGSAAMTLTLSGVNFATNSVVQLDGVPLTTHFVSATQLTAQVPASSLLTVRTAAVTVTNNTPVAVISASAPFGVSSVPTLGGIYPAGAAQGSGDLLVGLNGSGFTSSSVALWNGVALKTTFVNPNELTATIPAADLATAGSGSVTVSSSGTNGTITSAVKFPIIPPPVLSSVNPSTIQGGTSNSNSSGVTVTLTGSNFDPAATVVFGAYGLTIKSQTATQIVATITPQELFWTGAFPISVRNPMPSTGGVDVSSKPTTINVINPSATFTVSPNSAAVGSGDTKISISGTGFFADSVVRWNGTPLATTFVQSGSLTAIIPASDLASAGGGTISIATPENLGQTTPTTQFSTYLALPINALAYNAADGRLYATVAGQGGPGLGNSLIGIDPVTGTIQRTIFVGSEPTKLALSADGTQAFVGLNGAGAVRQVNLTTGTAGVQFSLGGTQGVYQPPFTAAGLAVLPGQPNSVAVYGSNGVVTIFDSGVARPKVSSGLNTYFDQNSGALTFGPSSSTLYLVDSSTSTTMYELTVDSTGVTGFKQLTSSAGGATVQYDNGRLYTPNGIVSDAGTGATLGQFSTTSTYSSGNVPANGPIYSDSSLNRAWVLVTSFSDSTANLVAYDEATFLPLSSTPVVGLSTLYGPVAADLVRWGQDGLAFHTGTQLYLLHGAFVKDTGSTPADLQVTVQAPSTVTTGTAFTYQVRVKNLGTSSATGVVLVSSLPETLLYNASTVSQGFCNGDGMLSCNLGDLANGATATLTVTATPSESGPSQLWATVDSQTYDPLPANNMVTASTTASGALFSAVPTVSSVSPNLIATGTTNASLTLNGTGFNTASVVQWNGTALPTTFVSATQLTATLDSSLLTNIGSGAVSVANPAPGGGSSGNCTVSVYDLLSVPANTITYDPYTRKLLALLPSTSTTLAGNSLVSIDPATGAAGTPVQVGSEPNTIAESPGGNYVYIGLSGSKQLARFNMSSQSVDVTVPLVNTSYFGGPTAANGLAAIPGLEDSVAVDNVGIFDFNGTTATERPTSILGFNDAVFPDSSHAYTYDNGSTGAEIYRYTVDGNGVHLIDSSTMLGMGGFSGNLMLDQGLLFGAAGGIIDPTTTPLTQVGVLPLGAGLYGSSLMGGGAIPYQATQKDFVAAVNVAGNWLVSLERFDTQHFVLEDAIGLPSGDNIIESIQGIRWGQDGLAVLIPGGMASSNPTQLMLLRGAFVLPSEASSNSAPVLSSAGTGSVAAGSGNQSLIVTGTGFMPGASVLWNGVPYSTTFKDAQHLSVAVGAADIRTKDSVKVTVRNPGSAASNSVVLTVQ